MAESFGYFDGLEYNESFPQQRIKSLINNGIYNNTCGVTAAGNMNISVAAGQAWINGYYYLRDSSSTYTLETAHATLARKDAVVIRYDRANKEIKVKMLTGTPSSNPQSPVIWHTDDYESYYDLQLAIINVPAGVTTITQAFIQDTRLNNAVCGLVSGILEPLDTAQFYQQVQDDMDTFKSNEQTDFNVWFNSVKGQLSTDAASNLQNQIDNLTTDDVTEGTNKYVTAADKLSWNDHVGNTSIHVTTDDKNSWNSRINPNILINGDAKVWQRGTSFSLVLNGASWVYCEDRWRYKFAGSVGATAVVSKPVSGGGVLITITGTGTVTRQQVMEESITGTLSKKVDSTVTSEAFSGTTIQQVFTATSTVYWTKLEIGNINTPFSPKLFSEELASCLRYFETSYTYGTVPGTATISGMYTFLANALGYGTQSIVVTVQYTVAKKSSPAVLTYDSAGTVGKVDGASWVTNTSRSLGDATHKMFSVYLSASNPGVRFHWTADAEFYS